jgi:hypothetical protein
MFPTLSDPQSLVSCIDECYFSERVLPLYGYSKVGTKCVVRGPGGGWKKRSLLLSVRSDGQMDYVIYDGSINGQRFHDFIRKLPYPDGTTIVMDNISFHKSQSSFQQKGYVPIYIPPYSPDFNGPVENSFSKIKAAFRSMWPWNSQGVDACIHTAVRTLSPADIVASFQRLKRFVTSHHFQM